MADDSRVTPFRPARAVSLLTGGGDKPYAQGMARALIAAGVTFDCIASDDLDAPEFHGNPLIRFLNLRGEQNPNVPVWKKLWRVWRYYLRLMIYALTSRNKVFHLLWNNKWEYLDRTLVLLYYKILGKRLAFTAHNVNIRWRDGGDSWLNRATLRFQYHLVDHIFVHTQQMRRELHDHFGVSENKVTVIPFGINDTTPRTALTGGEARKRLGLDPKEKVILFFGQIAPYKGLEYAVQAHALLNRDGSRFRLIVAGRPKNCPDYWANIEAQLREARSQKTVLERIEFVPDEETEVFFKAADVLVLPYVHIFQSGVLFLAYNFGLPVVATDVGSLKEDIVEGQTGFVCQPRDAQGLADALAKYFASDLFQNLPDRRAGVEKFASERYSWAKVAEMTEAIYSRLS